MMRLTWLLLLLGLTVAGADAILPPPRARRNNTMSPNAGYTLELVTLVTVCGLVVLLLWLVP